MASVPVQRHVLSQPYSWPFDGDLRPENTCLLAIDMQTDFCGKGGYVDNMGYDISMTRAPIMPLQAIFASFRKQGYHIIHTREGHKASLADCPTNKRWRSRQIGAGIGDPGPCGRVLVRGELGWNLIPELQPTEQEEIIDKPGKGSFVATDLDLILKQKKIKNLIFTGITTDVCVSTTMREANDLGYECLLLSDCTAATDYGNYMATLKTTQQAGGVIGCVAAAADLLKAIGEEVPRALEDLEMVDLGDGICVRIPNPCGKWMPKSVSETVVSQKKTSESNFVEADPYLWPFDGQLTPENTTLLSINFQKIILGDFAKSNLQEVVKHSAEVLEIMRRKGFPVLHVRTGYAENLSDASRRAAWRSQRCQSSLFNGLIRGDPGWEFLPELAPLPTEAVVEKCGIGAFSLTSLEVKLHCLGTRNLVIIGVATDVCVHTTMRQANDRGYECILLSDCTAAAFPETYYSALKQIKMQHGVFGAVADSTALLKTLAAVPDRPQTEGLSPSEPDAKRLRSAK